MSHLPLNDWARLGEEWRAQPFTQSVDHLRRRVHRQTFRLYAIVAAEVLLTIAASAVIAAALVKSSDAETKLVSAGLGVFSAIIWGFALRNRRGIWRTAGDTIAAYRALEGERLRRRIASARFSWRLCAIALVPMLLLTARHVALSGPRSTAALISAAACCYLLAWIIGGRLMEKRLGRRVNPPLNNVLDVNDEEAVH